MGSVSATGFLVHSYRSRHDYLPVLCVPSLASESSFLERDASVHVIVTKMSLIQIYKTNKDGMKGPSPKTGF